MNLTVRILISVSIYKFRNEPDLCCPVSAGSKSPTISSITISSIGNENRIVEVVSSLLYLLSSISKKEILIVRYSSSLSLEGAVY